MPPRRPLVHPVPKALSSEAIVAEQAALAAAQQQHDNDISYQTDELTGTYAFNKVNKVKKAPGPATYGSASKSYTSFQAPRATIGKEERFSSTFAGMFVRAECASELQCRDSPGPIYSPTFSNLPRAQTVNWGSKRSQENVSRFHANHHLGGRDSMGPAAYHPLAQHILPQATQVHFGKSSRFDSFGGHAFAINNSPYTGGDGGDVRLCLAARTHTRECAPRCGEKPWLVSSSLTCWRVRVCVLSFVCAIFTTGQSGLRAPPVRRLFLQWRSRAPPSRRRSRRDAQSSPHRVPDSLDSRWVGQIGHPRVRGRTCRLLHGPTCHRTKGQRTQPCRKGIRIGAAIHTTGVGVRLGGARQCRRECVLSGTEVRV
jgi:hypothetical protein